MCIFYLELERDIDSVRARDPIVRNRLSKEARCLAENAHLFVSAMRDSPCLNRTWRRISSTKHLTRDFDCALPGHVILGIAIICGRKYK